MSAILGLIRWDGQAVVAQDFEPSLLKLATPPPDNQAIWTEESLGFAAYLSHLSPDNFPNEPVLVLDNLVLVAVVRLDNRDELCQHFAIPPQERETISDSRLILHAYQKWDEDCVRHLLGDFAFAIWDSRKKRLFTARDFIGARPFYYFHTPKSFGFASDLSALLAFPDLDVRIDEDELFLTLLRQPKFYTNPAKTLYKDVYRLAFAHQMTVQEGRVHLRQYWTGEDLPEIRYSSEEDYLERCRELLQAAVASRIAGKQKIGSHISGGLDSSTVTITAARLLRQEGRELRAYSWSPPVTHAANVRSELYRIQAISQQEGLEPVYIPYRPENLEEIFSPKGRRLQMELGVMRHAQANGIGVMLSGWGGDEFISLSGRGYQADLFARGQWRELYQTLRPFRPELDWFKHLLSRFWHFISLPLMPDVLFPYFRRSQKTYSAPLDDSCFEATFLKRLKASQAKYQEERAVIRGRLENQLKLYRQGHITNRIETWAAAGERHNLVYAYPLLDRRLVEFALAVPDKLYLQRGKPRYLFRQANALLFPPELRNFTAPKNEPENIAHGHVLRQLLAKHYQQAAVIHEDVPWIDKECLEARLKRVHTSEEWDSLRAVALLGMWRDLQKEIGEAKRN